MTRQNDECFSIYLDKPLFRDCVDYTANLTGFSALLIERDFFCSLVLSHLFAGENPLLFKGGTSIGKVYANFYRLSEDLDFLIPLDYGSTRPQRKKIIEPFKGQISELVKVFPEIILQEPLAGHRESRQYIAKLQYPSIISQQPGAIKLEISMREPLLLEPSLNNAKTILKNPYSLDVVLPLIPVRTLSLREAYAEKIRAALTRKEPAIRDFYDIEYALRSFPRQIQNESLFFLVMRKLAILGNDPPNTSSDRKTRLMQQMETHLKPVLRSQDYDRFDLEPAWQFVVKLAERIESTKAKRH